MTVTRADTPCRSVPGRFPTVWYVSEAVHRSTIFTCSLNSKNLYTTCAHQTPPATSKKTQSPTLNHHLSPTLRRGFEF